jgi:molybdopterin synthase catalytic subunit/molybdopterin synthase sulfur carrier subunit
MRVRLFASLRELAGTSEMEVDALDVGDLLDQLSNKLGDEFDRIMAAGSVMVDGERAKRERQLAGVLEVALLPPVSGGAPPSSRRPPNRGGST